MQFWHIECQNEDITRVRKGLNTGPQSCREEDKCNISDLNKYVYLFMNIHILQMTAFQIKIIQK